MFLNYHPVGLEHHLALILAAVSRITLLNSKWIIGPFVLVADVLRAREELDGLRHCKSRPFNPLTIIQVKNAERNVDNSENDTWWRSSNVLWNTTGCLHLQSFTHVILG